MHYKTIDYLINKLNISKKIIDLCVSTEGSFGAVSN